MSSKKPPETMIEQSDVYNKHPHMRTNGLRTPG